MHIDYQRDEQLQEYPLTLTPHLSQGVNQALVQSLM